ncbi:Beta-glucosidase [Rubrivivax sp. A210]|uniref:beta-glucosidase n=1 Tax=Rubrivivax sp. A210 TaxID=2772301 RepID=UPI00191AF063|nr:glycoside hydrolase family 3 C-terminal domain-containing protein [Rubrivivax sp. A210]CAD5372809.1 Beta-glucosidase [Rubrivivax sp. A210]
MRPNPPLDHLLDAMTLEEQASLLAGADFWTTVAVPRLGVPAIKLSDGPNGARGAVFKDGPRTACFPAGIALAASWSPALVEQAGAALGREARLKGARVLLAPTVNLQRTVYNGRNFECFSEDPWLASELAVACVRGVQSAGVAATIKHFVGNESEYQRMSISSDIPERALRELYLLPFERAVKEAGVMAVMTGYNRVGGVFMADHRRLVHEVLRGEWGFDGLVMSDWMATLDTVQGVLAGCDLEMPGPTRVRGALLVAAVQEGRLPAAAVRACAARVLRLAERLGSFADPVIPAERADDLPEHRALIRRLGAEGCVLLKNEAAVLPLAPRPGQTVALIGRAATVAQIMGGGSANVNAHYRVAPADALREACPGVAFSQHAGADIHRWTPVLAQPMTVEIFAGSDFAGPAFATQTLPNSEVQWIGTMPPGLVEGQVFSARTTLRFVADADGEHAFSLISAGLARATLNGEPVLDAWTNWRRGDTYFTFGCDEVVHRRHLRAGEVVELNLEFCNTPPGGGGPPPAFAVLRVGAARVLGEADIAAAVEAARAADVALVFAGLNAEWDNEGLDRPGMTLPHRQDELIARVAAANSRTVVVLQSGSPLLLPWLEDVSAVLQAWYPGQECGHAIADVLLGAADPGGRLPQTWPARIEDTVAFGDPAQYPGVDGHVAYGEGLLIGYRHHEARGIAPRFAFGHGLSYTSFAHEALVLSRSRLRPGEALQATLTVRNTGTRTGSEVVQLYVHAVEPALPRPPQELKAFAKLSLAPGQTQAVSLALGMRAFAAFDEARCAWVAAPGRYEIRVGASSADIRQRATLVLTDEWMERVGA